MGPAKSPAAHPEEKEDTMKPIEVKQRRINSRFIN